MSTDNFQAPNHLQEELYVQMLGRARRPMSDELIEKLKQAALAATAGADPAHPWQRTDCTVYQLEHHGWRKGVEQFQNRVTISVQGSPSLTDGQAGAVAAYIAAANPAAVLELIERLERAETRIKAMEREHFAMTAAIVHCAGGSIQVDKQTMLMIPKMILNRGHCAESGAEQFTVTLKD